MPIDDTYLKVEDKALTIDLAEVDKWVDAILLGTVMTGIDHTAISNLDLKPTGVKDTFTITLTWLDKGVAKVVEDKTPILLSRFPTLTKDSLKDGTEGKITPLLIKEAIEEKLKRFIVATIPANTLDTRGDKVDVVNGKIIDIDGMKLLYGDGVVYVIKDDVYTPLHLVKERVITENFYTTFTITGDAKVSFTGGTMSTRVDGVEKPYVSKTILSAGTYEMFGDNIDNVAFLNNVFTKIHIERNSDQTAANNMFANLNKLVDFTANPNSFSTVKRLYNTWRACTGLTSFPVINLSQATILYFTWFACSKLKTFPFIDTSSNKSLVYTWYGCYALKEFPKLDTSKVTNFTATWRNCIGLTSFPSISTGSGTTMSAAWNGCKKLKTFPFIDTSKVTNMNATWINCSSLISFPTIDTYKVTNISSCWDGCLSLANFPKLLLTNVKDAVYSWRKCVALISFPAIDLPNATKITGAWFNCTSLTSFPMIDLEKANDLSYAWQGCTSITSFPQLNLNTATILLSTWKYCKSLLTFPSIDLSKVLVLQNTWFACSKMKTFPILNLTSATNTTAMLSYNSNLICIAGIINDGVKADLNAGMFTSTNKLQRPTAAEQNTILNGNTWINDTPCP